MNYWKDSFDSKLNFTFLSMPWEEITLNDGRKFKAGDEITVSQEDIKFFKPFRNYIKIGKFKSNEEIPDLASITPRKRVYRKVEQNDTEIKSEE